MASSLSNDAEPLWRCLRSKPKAEHIAARHLQLGGWESYCPRVRHQRKTARGLVWFIEALFPGYVFAKFPLEAHRYVRATTSVAGLLDFTPGCGLISETALRELQDQFQDAEPLTVLQSPQEGDSVELTEGPFSGAPAVITKLLPGAERVQILMEFLGSPRHMEVSLRSLLGFHDPRIAAFGSTSSASF
jgi:transcriptional antiterminator RfaH